MGVKKLMNFLLILTIFGSISLTFAFDCSSVSTDITCKYMEGCKWEENSCEGSFNPTCHSNFSSCLYVYPSNDTHMTPDGTP